MAIEGQREEARMTEKSAKVANGTAPAWFPRTLGILAVFLCTSALPESHAASREVQFDNPFFQRCMTWLLEGTGGAMIGNLCIDQYDIPPPSLFICARKIRTGFQSANDQETCAVLFEEQVRKIRDGYVK
jgi:hypothetical protein